jgi:hypothetical protein
MGAEILMLGASPAFEGPRLKARVRGVDVWM